MIVRKTVEVEVKNLGDRIRESREAKGMSATELARRIGVTKQYIRQIERDHTTSGAISLKVLMAIEAALGTDFGVKL